jgi:hypothetical protein
VDAEYYLKISSTNSSNYIRIVASLGSGTGTTTVSMVDTCATHNNLANGTPRVVGMTISIWSNGTLSASGTYKLMKQDGGAAVTVSATVDGSSCAFFPTPNTTGGSYVFDYTPPGGGAPLVSGNSIMVSAQ